MQISDIERMAYSILEDGLIECDCIEYKKSVAFKDRILKTVCAFANNYMNREIGLLFIGVEKVDDTETGMKAFPKRPIEGIARESLEITENMLKKLLSEVHPKPKYHLLDLDIDGMTCLVIAVEPGTDGPYETSEQAAKDRGIALKPERYIRVRRDTRLPNKREEFELLKKFAGFHFSSELNETATLDDLNYEYMREYLLRTHANEDIRNLSKEEMAKRMGLVSGSEYGGLRARNFAVLMFADRPEDFIPGAHLEIIREAKGTDRMVATKFDGPIWMQVRRAIDFFREVIMVEYTVREVGLTGHRMVRNWPEVMFAELVTNCVLHKEYDKDNYVGVYVYAHEMTFVNHNRPLPPVTIEDMRDKESFDDRNYLNPEIKEMFFALNLIESYGSGLRRAKRAMRENGNPPLMFRPENDIDDYVEVVAPVNPEFAQMFAEEDGVGNAGGVQDSTQETTQKNGDTTQKTIQKNPDSIREYLRAHPSASAREISRELDINYDNVRYHINKLKEAGCLIRKGPDKGGSWVVIDKEGE